MENFYDYKFVGKENPYFNRRESGFFVPKDNRVTSESVSIMFGIDLKERIVDISRVFNLFPDGHELTFFKTGKEHKGSQALYLVEESVGEHKVYVSLLGPNSKTSIHKHDEPLVEDYYWLAGTSFLRLNDGIHELSEGQETISVPSENIHQLATREEASLALIVLKNGAKVPEYRLHRYQR